MNKFLYRAGRLLRITLVAIDIYRKEGGQAAWDFLMWKADL